MTFINTLIHRLLNKSAEQEEFEASNHYETLQLLQRNHEWIDVSIIKTEKSYQSLVLEIDPENHELLIDDLYPSEDLEKLETGDTIEISCKSRKVLVNFYTRILKREFIDGKGAFRVELPEEIGINHGRQAYRIFVHNEAQLAIEVQYHDEYLDDVSIVNLSTEGIKLNFAAELSEQLDKDRVLEHCLIKLPSGFDIDCSIELRNIYRIRTPHPHTLAGGTLTITQPQQRVKLEQYLASVQRQQRRREARIV
ncbi:MAG: flagellar brake protein [Spongiibacteraceae bacterium]|nr:flagellar brake protein [Spongiibacteraceae bacterium]